MLTVTTIRTLFKNVVTSYVEGISWASDWNKALDHDPTIAYPACLWKPPFTGCVKVGSTDADVFGLDVLLLDDTADDRTPEQRDEAYEKMEAIARICYRQFCKKYVKSTGLHEGQEIDLKVQNPPVFTAMWDQAGTMTTGVRMVVSFRNESPVPCLDALFN